MAETKMVITMKGQATDIAKVRASLDEGGEFRDILEGKEVGTNYGEIRIEDVEACNLNASPNTMEITPFMEDADCQEWYYAGEYIETVLVEKEVAKSFAALNSLFEPVFSAFPQVSFFIACSVANDDIYDHGAGYACSYAVFENGAEQEKDSWGWATPTYAGDDWDRFETERDHYHFVMNDRFRWIEKKREFWLLEGSADGDAIQAAREALSQAEKWAVEADVECPPLVEEEDDDTPAEIAAKRIRECQYNRGIEDDWRLDLSGLGLTDDDFDEIGMLSPLPDSVKASRSRYGVQYLDLSGNPLTRVPETLKRKKEREDLIELDLSNTRISELPEWLDLPGISPQGKSI